MSMIQPVSNQISGGLQVPALAGAKGVPEVRQSGTEVPSRAQRPARDEYVPEEKQEPSGRYWLGKDEDGRPKIYFDDPEQPEKPSEASGPIKEADGDKTEQCTANTDQVDREIERLKQQKETLEQKIRTETDEIKVRELERKLSQAERELNQKDSDAYRRQHAVFS